MCIDHYTIYGRIFSKKYLPLKLSLTHIVRSSCMWNYIANIFTTNFRLILALHLFLVCFACSFCFCCSFFTVSFCHILLLFVSLSFFSFYLSACLLYITLRSVWIPKKFRRFVVIIELVVLCCLFVWCECDDRLTCSSSYCSRPNRGGLLLVDRCSLDWLYIKI